MGPCNQGVREKVRVEGWRVENRVGMDGAM